MRGCGLLTGLCGALWGRLACRLGPGRRGRLRLLAGRATGCGQGCVHLAGCGVRPAGSAAAAADAPGVPCLRDTCARRRPGVRRCPLGGGSGCVERSLPLLGLLLAGAPPPRRPQQGSMPVQCLGNVSLTCCFASSRGTCIRNMWACIRNVYTQQWGWYMDGRQPAGLRSRTMATRSASTFWALPRLVSRRLVPRWGSPSGLAAVSLLSHLCSPACAWVAAGFSRRSPVAAPVWFSSERASVRRGSEAGGRPSCMARRLPPCLVSLAGSAWFLAAWRGRSGSWERLALARRRSSRPAGSVAFSGVERPSITSRP